MWTGFWKSPATTSPTATKTNNPANKERERNGKMEYEVKTVKKVGAAAYEGEMNSILQAKAQEGWKLQQLLGSPDQGILLLFAREK